VMRKEVDKDTEQEMEKGGDLRELIASGKLKVLLEAYSDILVRRIRDKL
jgi:hypothetical protein